MWLESILSSAIKSFSGFQTFPDRQQPLRIILASLTRLWLFNAQVNNPEYIWWDCNIGRIFDIHGPRLTCICKYYIPQSRLKEKCQRLTHSVRLFSFTFLACILVHVRIYKLYLKSTKYLISNQKGYPVCIRFIFIHVFEFCIW